MRAVPSQIRPIYSCRQRVRRLSLALATEGYAVVGIDLAPTAIAAATKAAQERGLPTASFLSGRHHLDHRVPTRIRRPLHHNHR